MVELAWGFSTTIGVFLFLLEIATLCWVKFYTINHVVAWTATGILIPVIFIFMAFAAHFYYKLVSYKTEIIDEDITELEKLKEHLQNSVESQIAIANCLAGIKPTESRRPKDVDHIV